MRIRNIAGLLFCLAVAVTGCRQKTSNVIKAIAPRHITIYKNPKDSSADYYTTTLPKGSVKGLLVIENGQLTDKSKILAYDMGIMTMTVVPVSNSLDMLTGDEPLAIMDSLIAEVVAEHDIPPNKILIGGMSVEGTGAMRYVQYCELSKSKAGIKPAGLFGVDPPLDYERLWHESEHGVERNFSPDAVAEGKFVMLFLNDKMGGTPYNHIEAYRKASPFCYSAKNGGNAYLLNSIPLRIYVEPNINWWITNRRKDYYDLNAMDQAALINQLKINGNKDAELVTTINKGKTLDGSYHPHSWSILNEDELLKWCLKLFGN